MKPTSDTIPASPSAPDRTHRTPSQPDAHTVPKARLDLQRWENEGGMIYDVPPVDMHHVDLRPGDVFRVTDVSCNPITGETSVVLRIEQHNGNHRPTRRL